MNQGPSTFRLVLGPLLLTTLVCVVRLVGEVQGWISPRSGGALHPLGISWLAFVFGVWFAVRLQRDGSAPRLEWSRTVATLPLLGLSAAVAWQFGPFAGQPADDATFGRLRIAVLILVTLASTAAAVAFAVWPRLAWTMLAYALPTRLVVFLITWFAKVQGYDTHYVKFGPPGIERDLPDTLLATALAQGGFWVPFTVVCGVALGVWFARSRATSVRR